MASRGCWDNAVVESSVATLTKPLFDDVMFATRKAARRELPEFIEVWYDRERQHSSFGF